jgi:pimeloyl-ACP methyl ester carboxylesterase
MSEVFAHQRHVPAEQNAQSFIDDLKLALQNHPQPINKRALQNWRTSSMTSALLRRIQGFATGMQRRSTYIRSQEMIWLEGGNPQGEPLVLVHGFASSKENWILLLPFLTRRYRVFVPDLPGWGESSFQYGEAYGISDQIERFNNWAERYLPDQFHLVGSSMGGGLGALYAAQFPDRVLSLTLMNALGVAGPEKTPFEHGLHQGHNALITHRLSDVVHMMSTVTSYHRWMLTALLVPLMYQELVMRRHVNTYMFHELLERAPSNVFDGISDIRCPTLVLWGEKDQILHASCAEVFQQLIPHADVKLLKEVGHLPMVEAPAQTARALLHFWQHSKSQAALAAIMKARAKADQAAAMIAG